MSKQYNIEYNKFRIEMLCREYLPAIENALKESINHKHDVEIIQGWKNLRALMLEELLKYQILTFDRT